MLWFNFTGHEHLRGHAVSNCNADGPIGSRQRFLTGRDTQLSRDLARVELERDLPAAGKKWERFLLFYFPTSALSVLKMQGEASGRQA